MGPQSGAEIDEEAVAQARRRRMLVERAVKAAATRRENKAARNAKTPGRAASDRAEDAVPQSPIRKKPARAFDARELIGQHLAIPKNEWTVVPRRFSSTKTHRDCILFRVADVRAEGEVMAHAVLKSGTPSQHASCSFTVAQAVRFATPYEERK